MNEKGGFGMSAATATSTCADTALPTHRPVALSLELAAPPLCVLGSLGVGLDDFVCDWLSSLFLSTLALDTAARVWDCYLLARELRLSGSLVLRWLMPFLIARAPGATALLSLGPY